MNLAFLGEALDHWKGSLFESLQASHLLRDFAVDPMATDLPEWTEGDFALFASLLRVDPAQILRHHKPLSAPSEYFGELSHRGDLFLDPDIGVRTGPVKEPQGYVRPEDLCLLLRAAPGRMLLVYQHIRAQRPADRVNAVLSAIEAAHPRLNWSSYESATVAMLFLSSDSTRTTGVQSHFQRLLGRHAEGRIRGGSS